MTRKELAEKLGVDPTTLRNWEMNKPELVRLINQGLALDEYVEEIEKNLQKLKEIKESADCGKFKLK